MTRLHRFIHDVMRISPSAVEYIDYCEPDTTTALWFCEADTSHQAYLNPLMSLPDPADDRFGI